MLGLGHGEPHSSEGHEAAQPGKSIKRAESTGKPAGTVRRMLERFSRHTTTFPSTRIRAQREWRFMRRLHVQPPAHGVAEDEEGEAPGICWASGSGEARG